MQRSWRRALALRTNHGRHASRASPRRAFVTPSTSTASASIPSTLPPHSLSTRPPPAFAALPSTSPSTRPARISTPPPIPTVAAGSALRPSIPPANAALHAALSRLSDTATSHVSLSRLQLALRSLESTTPTVRVGILGAGGAAGNRLARRLARLLLADPLGNEEEWERELAESDGRAVLLRLAEEEGQIVLERANPLLKEMRLRSPALRRARVEVLVAPVSLEQDVGEGSEADRAKARRERAALERVLVPVLQSPLAGSGRAGFVRFPLHQALVVGESLKGAVKLEKLSAELGELASEGSIIVAADLPSVERKNLDDVQLTNVEAAERAFAEFRRDVSTGPAFSSAWQSSGLARLAATITEDVVSSQSDNGALRPAVAVHISSLLDTTLSTLEEAETAARLQVDQHTFPEKKRQKLQTSITEWSEFAHTELQRSLALAFDAPTWRRTAFPRILWRIDDVPYAAAAALETQFLVQTEALLAYLSGRLEQAGFPVAEAPLPKLDGPTSQAAALESLAKLSPDATSPDVPTAAAPKVIVTKDNGSLNGLKHSPFETSAVADTASTAGITTQPRPWPRAIEARRLTLIVGLIPQVHARAQALTLQFYGTTGTAAALGGWYVAATAGTGVYEAGAVFALGLVWALRRLQRLWGGERDRFEAEVKEQGRLVLGDVENRLRLIVRDGQRFDANVGDQGGLDAARAAVEAAKVELEKLRS